MAETIDRFAWKVGQTNVHPSLLPGSLTQGKYVHSFLSNFYPCRLKWEGAIYPSLENAYQAAKASDRAEREPFENVTPGAAKKMGRRVGSYRPEWDEVKLGVMGLLVIQKFTIHEPFRRRLLETGEAELVEGNDWGDDFWGCVWQPAEASDARGVGGRVGTGRWFGENELGKILMGTRDLLRRAAGIE